MQGKKRSQQLCCVVNMFKTHLPPPPFACQRMISYNTSSFSSFPFFQTCYCIEHAASRARAPTLSLLSLITLCRKQYCMSNGEGEKEASLVRYVRKKPPTLQNWSKKKKNEFCCCCFCFHFPDYYNYYYFYSLFLPCSLKASSVSPIVWVADNAQSREGRRDNKDNDSQPVSQPHQDSMSSGRKKKEETVRGEKDGKENKGGGGGTNPRQTRL